MNTLKKLLFAAVCLLGLAALPSESFANPGRRNAPPPVVVQRPPVIVVYVQYVAPSRPLPLLPLATINAPCLPLPRYVYGRRW